jgi:hypothetical protein
MLVFIRARMRGGLDSHEQRLRLSDLRHFGRRRKPFQGRRENGLGFGQAAGRLMKLGEEKGRQQFVAACALLLRDGKGGLECLFGGDRIGGIAAEQDLAAQAMEVRVGVMLSRLLRGRQSLVDQRQSGVRIYQKAGGGATGGMRQKRPFLVSGRIYKGFARSGKRSA